jgi:hypothetical protein
MWSCKTRYSTHENEKWYYDGNASDDKNGPSSFCTPQEGIERSGSSQGTQSLMSYSRSSKSSKRFVLVGNVYRERTTSILLQTSYPTAQRTFLLPHRGSP